MRWKGQKAKAWEAVRAYIKLRDGDNCFTCMNSGPDFSYDTGHCWPVAIVGSNNTLSWDERQIARQCKRCNGPGQGMQEAFIRKLTQKYGAKTVAELRGRVYRVDPIKDWGQIIDHFTKLRDTVETRQA